MSALSWRQKLGLGERRGRAATTASISLVVVAFIPLFMTTPDPLDTL